MSDLAKPRIFDADSLKAVIQTTMAQAKPGHQNAMVGYWTTDGKWRTSYAWRAGDDWIIGGTFGQDQARGKVSGGVFFAGSW